MMLVQSATPEAEIAAENAVLGGRRALRHAVVPHGGFADPEYGSVGPTEVEARREQDGTVAVVPYADLDRGSIDGHRVGSCKLIVSRATQCVLGAHIVGEQAVEVVQIAATAMRAAMRVEKLADLELAYPTFTAVVGLAARDLAHPGPGTARVYGRRRQRAAQGCRMGAQKRLRPPVGLLAGGQRLVEPAHLAGRLVGVDDALRGGLVVGPLRLVPELAGPLPVAGLERPVEPLGEVLQSGLDAAVLLEPLQALLVALGWCGHAHAPLALLLL
jgi:hypothetical protein